MDRSSASRIPFANLPAIEAMLRQFPRQQQPTGLMEGGNAHDPQAGAPATTPSATAGGPPGGTGPVFGGAPAPAPQGGPPGGVGPVLNQAPAVGAPGGVVDPLGAAGNTVFNREGLGVFGADATALAEIYAQEQGWSPQSGQRAMFSDEFQKADAAWDLFATGAVATDITQKEAFVREYLAQATMPGGSYYTEDQVRNAILNGPPDSAFNMQMQSLGADQQVSYTIATYNNALAGTVPAPMLQARVAQLEQWGREYLAWVHTRQATGPGMSFTEWLKATGKM